LSSEEVSTEGIWRKFICSTEIGKSNAENQLAHVPFIEEPLSSARLSSKPLILELIKIDNQP